MLAPMRRTVHVIALWLLCVACCRVVHADGKVFTHAAPAEIPSQSALIVYDGKVETLAIETRFVAEGKDFAWVVPLPAVPEIESGTPGMFPSLRAMFLPDIISSSNAPVTLVVVLLVLLALGVWGTLLGAGPMWRVILYWLAGLAAFGSCLLLPSLGVARAVGGGGGGGGVDVVERKIIGEFELETVRADDADVLDEWLRSRGFALPTAARDAVRLYVGEGWVFVAVKLRREFEKADLSAPTPLVFKFPTRQCVYPMRLTGADASTPLDVELYVFADRAASASGFRSIRHSAVVAVEDADTPPQHKSSDILVSHRRVRSLIGGSTHATLMRASLRPEQMSADVQIDLAERREHGGIALGSSVARHVAVCCGLLVASGVGLYYQLRSPRAGRSHRPWVFIRNSASAGVGAALFAFVAIPTVPEVAGGWREHMNAYRVGESIYWIVDRIPEDATNTQIGDMMLNAAADERPNLRLPKHEDSPGNFTVRRIDGGFEVSVYSWRGQERTSRIIPDTHTRSPASPATPQAPR